MALRVSPPPPPPPAPRRCSSRCWEAPDNDCRCSCRCCCRCARPNGFAVVMDMILVFPSGSGFHKSCSVGSQSGKSDLIASLLWLLLLMLLLLLLFDRDDELLDVPAPFPALIADSSLPFCELLFNFADSSRASSSASNPPSPFCCCSRRCAYDGSSLPPSCCCCGCCVKGYPKIIQSCEAGRKDPYGGNCVNESFASSSSFSSTPPLWMLSSRFILPPGNDGPPRRRNCCCCCRCDNDDDDNDDDASSDFHEGNQFPNMMMMMMMNCPWCIIVLFNCFPIYCSTPTLFFFFGFLGRFFSLTSLLYTYA